MAPVNAGAAITPSMNSLAWRTCIDGAARVDPWSNRRCCRSSSATAACGVAPLSRSISTAKWARAVSLPRRCSAVKAVIVSGSVQASRKLVMPWRRIAFKAALEAARFSFAFKAGMKRIARSWAASSSRPVASPCASRTILPPVGSGVARRMPASAMAREFNCTEWPNEERTITGRVVLSASSVAAVVPTPSGCMPCWNQFTTSSGRSEAACLSRSMQAWMRAWNCGTVRRA